MKRKLKIDILLSSLLMAFSPIGLGGCDKDDENLWEDVYQGYIVMIDQEWSGFIINVTHIPYNIKGKPFKGQNKYRNKVC